MTDTTTPVPTEDEYPNDAQVEAFYGDATDDTAGVSAATPAGTDSWDADRPGVRAEDEAPASPPELPITAGAVVTARPWQRGTELPAQRAIVLSATWLGAHEHAVVWFPRLGAPEIGPTVMAILQRKITEVRPLAAEAPTFVRNAYRAARRVNGAGAWQTEWRGAGFVLEAAARAL